MKGYLRMWLCPERLQRLLGWVIAGLLTQVAWAAAPVATTTITDTVYHADGTPASGLILVSWPAFTAGSGQTVPAGSVSVAVATGGAMTVALAPNVGATPAGVYYTAVYHLDDGSTSRETWLVPPSATPVTISAVRSTVVPAAVAVQTVTKTYVDNAIAAAVAGGATAGTIPFVTKAGDAMTGPLILPGDPTGSLQAASKHYVDASVAGVTGALTQAISTVPSGTQTVTQPQGTQLVTNRLNGELYASQYVNGTGNNGIANAAASTDCAGGCVIEAEPTYTAAETPNPIGWPSSGAGGTHLVDERGGSRRDTFMNAINPAQNGLDVGQTVSVISTRSAQSVSQANGSQSPSSGALQVNHIALTGGNNLFPASIVGQPPYFKSNYLAEEITGSYNTMGQHVLSAHTQSCFGVGDCLMGSQFLLASGGFRDEADEAAHPFDLQIREDARVFTGACAAGCAPGSTQVTVGSMSNPGTQGEGRYLLDMRPALAITTGTLTGGAFAAAGSPGPTATFSGTQFPVSVLLQTANSALSQAHNVAPGTVTLAVGTTGLPAGFAASTTALPASTGVACIVDQQNGYNPTNYEMASYSVVDGTHLQVALNKPHAAGATVAVSGLCGYGLEQKVDTTGPIRQVFPVIGSSSPTSLWYAGHLTAEVGVSGQASGYLNATFSIASIARAGGTVSVATTAGMPDLNGLTLTVGGVADASFNGSFAVTSTSGNTLTYSQAGADGTSSGGTIGMTTGAYALYPMAEVLGVVNPATQALDGTMTLAANTVPWAANDPVEQPHYFEENVEADQELLSQFVPRPTLLQRAGLVYQRGLGPGMRGWAIQNAVPASSYLGNGGTHSAPDVAYEALGIWNRSFEAQAGESAAFALHCNSHGCGRWNSAYDLFQLDSSAGVDTVHYAPQTSSLTLNLRGVTFGFGPSGFTTGALQAGSLTATGASRFSGDATVFGSGTPLLTGAANEAYLQAVSSASRNAGVFVSRGSTGQYASLDLVTGPTGNTGWSLQMQPNATDAVLLDRVLNQPAMVCHSGTGCVFPMGVSGPGVNGVLGGATNVIGGSALGAGSCASGTAAVGGAVVGTPVLVSASDGSLPGGTMLLSAAVSAPGQVTVQVCAVAAGTPAAKTYNVRVVQ